MRARFLLFLLSATLVRADFIVSVSNTSGTAAQIQRYSDTGVFLNTMVNGAGGLNTPEGVTLGPDGNLYVADFATGDVKRYNGQSGAFVDIFASDASLLNSIIGVTFGPNGNLYASSYNGASSAVREFNGTTGSLIGTFNIAAGSGGISGPLDMEFDGSNLLVSSSGTNQVLRYSSLTGAFLGAAASGGGLNFPDGLALDKAQNILYVSSSFSDSVLKYNALTGAPLGSFATLPNGARPVGLLLQSNGNLIVAANGSQTMYQYAPDGSLLGSFGNPQFTAVNGFPTYLAEIPTQAPEPSTAALLVGGALLVWSRKRKRASH